MRVLITRYPASEDRLIVRPLLCRRCALRLQPAEPQPYTQHQEQAPSARTRKRLAAGRRRTREQIYKFDNVCAGRGLQLASMAKQARIAIRVVEVRL